MSPNLSQQHFSLTSDLLEGEKESPYFDSGSNDYTWWLHLPERCFLMICAIWLSEGVASWSFSSNSNPCARHLLFEINTTPNRTLGWWTDQLVKYTLTRLWSHKELNQANWVPYAFPNNLFSWLVGVSCQFKLPILAWTSIVVNQG